MDFERSGFIRRLSSKFYRRVYQQILSEGCPINYIEGLSKQILLDACLTDLFSEGCPMDFYIGDCPMNFQKQKSFVLKTVFHT